MTKNQIITIGCGFIPARINLDNMKQTKAVVEVKNRIENSNKYDVFVNGEVVTVNSQWVVTKQEIAILEKVTGLKYQKIGSIVDKKGFWADWIVAE